MKLSEMEKRMLYQMEGNDRYAILNELSMAIRYAGDPARRKASQSLMEKLRILPENECMDVVQDIQKNYQLPQKERTIGEMIAEARQKSGAEKLKGHDIMALERFDPEVKHMIVFKVLSGDCTVGDRGERMRLFLSETGYQKFLAHQEEKIVKIENHAKVFGGGRLHYDNRDHAL